MEGFPTSVSRLESGRSGSIRSATSTRGTSTSRISPPRSSPLHACRCWTCAVMTRGVSSKAPTGPILFSKPPMTTLESVRPRRPRRVGGHSEHPTRVIHPRAPGAVARAREFWDSRRLIPYFATRFIRKMYTRTWLGRLWIPLRPTLDVATRTIIFGGLLGVASGSIPYVLFLLVGMLLWRLLSSAAYWMTRSVELNRRFLTRMYVPRLTLLVAAIGPPAVWFLMYVILTAIIFGYFLIAQGTFSLAIAPGFLLVPVAIALTLALCASIGFWTSVYGAQARDV